MAITDLDKINSVLKGKEITRLHVNTAGQVELWWKKKGAKDKTAKYILITANLCPMALDLDLQE